MVGWFKVEVGKPLDWKGSSDTTIFDLGFLTPERAAWPWSVHVLFFLIIGRWRERQDGIRREEWDPAFYKSRAGRAYFYPNNKTKSGVCSSLPGTKGFGDIRLLDYLLLSWSWFGYRRHKHNHKSPIKSLQGRKETTTTGGESPDDKPGSRWKGK